MINHDRDSVTRVVMGTGGRLVIPSLWRERLGLQEGTAVTMRETADGALLLQTQKAGLRRARQLVRQHVPPGTSLVDQLSEERRQAAEDE